MWRSFQIGVKHLLDRVVALVGLIVLAPLLILIAIVIRLDSRGRALFGHRRPGWREKRFTVWKFRTMVADADRHLDADGRVGEVQRVTRVGRWLRLLSLDELPQLINILKGEMSFVGPRPAIEEHLARYTAEQRRRFAMRPGITGLAQVSGRNRIKWSRRIAYDLEYIDRYSLLLDLGILLRTVKVVLTGEGVALDRNPEQVDDLARPGQAEPAASEHAEAHRS